MMKMKLFFNIYWYQIFPANKDSFGEFSAISDKNMKSILDANNYVLILIGRLSL